MQPLILVDLTKHAPARPGVREPQPIIYTPALNDAARRWLGEMAK